VINEPEWLVVNYKVVDWKTLQKFVAKIASILHVYAKKYVTLGSASLKWNSDVSPAEKNYWSN
jgi:hypothetical protein